MALVARQAGISSRMVRDKVDGIFVVATIAQFRNGLSEQMFVFAQVGIVAEKALSDGEGAVYCLC